MASGLMGEARRQYRRTLRRGRAVAQRGTAAAKDGYTEAKPPKINPNF